MEDASVTSDKATDDETQRLLQKALQLLAHRESAKLCAFMFCLHKTNMNQWLTIREVLLRHAVNHRQLSSIGLVVECSIKEELSSCYSCFPGLVDLMRQSNH